MDLKDLKWLLKELVFIVLLATAKVKDVDEAEKLKIAQLYYIYMNAETPITR